MKNKLTDLNNHLFEQLERLNDDDLTEEELEKELKRSKAMTDVGKTIIDNANLMLQGQKFVDNSYGIIRNKDAAKILIGNEDD